MDSLDPSDDSPRRHHYVLAHQALRSVAFDHPVPFLGILVSDRARPFLAELLENVHEHCKDDEPEAGFGAEDLSVHPGRIGDHACVIVELPRPRGVTEAYFVAAVLMVDLQREAPEEEKPPLRYFTLEYGARLSGPARTVLCEWTAEGSHLNYGDGPEPTVAAFAAAIERMLTR
jgi:hypothetical protein